jgi:hypothetical protein
MRLGSVRTRQSSACRCSTYSMPAFLLTCLGHGPQDQCFQKKAQERLHTCGRVCSKLPRHMDRCGRNILLTPRKGLISWLDLTSLEPLCTRPSRFSGGPGSGCCLARACDSLKVTAEQVEAHILLCISIKSPRWPTFIRHKFHPGA